MSDDLAAGSIERPRSARAAAIRVLAVSAALLLDRAPAQAAALAFQCVNSASGASWKVLVDDERRTVDGNPAQISPSHISWREGTGIYDLDRATGALTFTNASSTGGYTLFHKCQPVR